MVKIKIISRIGRLLKGSFIDTKSRRFIEHNRKQWNEWECRDKKDIILVDFAENPQTVVAFSYFCNVLSRHLSARLVSFSPRSRIFTRRLSQIFDSFNVREHLVTQITAADTSRKNELLQEIRQVAQSKQALLDFEIQGIGIGIDIYETYLRYGNATLDLADPKLQEIFEEAATLFVFWESYFSQNCVKAVITSHDCYLYLNIVNKFAYKYKVPVYIVRLEVLLRAEFPCALTEHFRDFPAMFRQLPPAVQEQMKTWASQQLKRRFEGEKCVDMPYAIGSAFSPVDTDKKFLKEGNKLKVLICSHCFFDNPHVYGGFLFADFYEWLCFLGEISARTNYDWYLKLHPEPLAGTYDIVTKILAQYPQITLLPSQVSHHQLVAEGIGFVFTVYGTVGIEYPAMGIPVVNAGYSPTMAYNFNFAPRSLDEYEALIMNLESAKKSIDLDKVIECYAMYYGYTVVKDLVFDSYDHYLEIVDSRRRMTSDVYEYMLDNFRDSKHQSVILNMQGFIESNRRQNSEFRWNFAKGGELNEYHSLGQRSY